MDTANNSRTTIEVPPLGKEHPADFYTKSLDAATSNFHTTKLGYSFRKGRSAEAPQLHMMAQPSDDYNSGRTQEFCEWIQILLSKVSKSKFVEKSKVKKNGMYSVSRDEKTQHGKCVNSKRCKQFVGTKQHVVTELSLGDSQQYTTTDVWQQVLWGST